MPRIEFLKDILFGLTVYIYYKDHGFPHVEVRKGTGKNPEAILKVRVDNFDILEVRGFSEKSVNTILKSLELYQKELLEEWNEKQKK